MNINNLTKNKHSPGKCDIFWDSKGYQENPLIVQIKVQTEISITPENQIVSPFKFQKT